MENFDGKRSYRRAGTALYITLAVAFLLIAVFIAMAIFFNITEITVEGAKKYTQAQILEASGIEKDGSIFFLNAGEAEIAIKNALPYVDTVKIARNLPGTVTIIVTESEAAAYFTYGGSSWITDIDGRILEETSSAPANLTELRGIAAESPDVGKNLNLSETVRLRGLKDLLATLKKSEMLDLTTWIDMTNLSAVTFEYNGYKVNISGTDDLDFKFSILINQVFAQHTEKGYGQSVIYQENGSFRYEG